MMRSRLSTRRAAVVLMAAASAASLSAGAVASPSVASPSTTLPQTLYKAKIVLTNTRILIKPRKVGRGALVQFQVKNAGTRARDFFIGGYLIHSLKPSGSRSFQLQFLERGRYPYYSKGHPGKKITGTFEVT